MELVFLGTACMMPTKDRSHAAMLLTFGKEGLLFDCGEGAQRQLRIAEIRPTRITRILISHWHGDHVLGLPGLLQTIAASNPEAVIDIYGPKGSGHHVRQMMDWFANQRVPDIRVHEATGKIIDTDDFSVESLPLEHGIPTVGFRFVEKDRRRINLSFVRSLGIPDGPILGELQEGKTVEWKGKKVSPKDATVVVKGKILTYITDTGITKTCFTLAKDADVLVSEATFAGDLQEKADEYQHLSVQDAVKIANTAGAKKLVLTHLSQRYKDSSLLQDEARTLFPETVIAYDFMKMGL